MSSLIVDTHTIIWYLLASAKISQKAITALDEALEAGNFVYLPSICLVEILYLVEKGRLPKEAFDRINLILSNPESGFEVAPLDLETARVVQRTRRSAIPDMPDRMIAATALFLNLPLVTRDKKIEAAGITTLW